MREKNRWADTATERCAYTKTEREKDILTSARTTVRPVSSDLYFITWMVGVILNLDSIIKGSRKKFH